VIVATDLVEYLITCAVPNMFVDGNSRVEIREVGTGAGRDLQRRSG